MESHNIPPVYDINSRILILGSFPSVKSRESNFFYGNPQNRLWKVLSALYCVDALSSVEEKRKFLIKNNIAMWDVIKSCDIKGSDDSSIENVIPNDISFILTDASIERIYCNGTTSYMLYNRFMRDKTGIKAIRLPSTSPANASFSLEKLIELWRVILE